MNQVRSESVPQDMTIQAMITAAFRPRCEFVLNMIVRSACELSHKASVVVATAEGTRLVGAAYRFLWMQG